MTKQLHCFKCNYDWTPRKKGEFPKQCPRCKRYDYNKEGESNGEQRKK